MRNKKGLCTVLVEAVGKYLISLCFVCSHVYVRIYVYAVSIVFSLCIYVCMYVGV